ncbi:MAG: cytochrome-c peroxidase [Chloroflexi bacterium]|nr:MAG: cytochrome-c peroxidase [Chloroflexota bacterium]
MKTRWIQAVFLPLIFCLGGAGCSDSNNNNVKQTPVATLDDEVRQLISAYELTGNPATGRDLPDISDPVAQLGMKLFFTKSLGGQTDAACVSCHHPVLGGGDDLSLPIGVDAEIPDLLGPGRLHSSAGFGFDGGPTVPRNAPTTFNMGLWDQVVFHDGRVESLGKTVGKNGDDGHGIRTPDTAFGVADEGAKNLTQAQALFPVTSPEEMRAKFKEGDSNQQVRDALAARLVGQDIPNTWLEEFQEAFDSDAAAEDLITFLNISLAIGFYENSQVLVDNPWRAYVEGDDAAIGEAAKRGARLFYTSSDEGGADCVACHSGDFFTDEQFHVLAAPQVGRGKGDGEFSDDDFGRFRETGTETDRYAFRTPALLNVNATGPWTHAGAYSSLAEVVRHHADPGQAIYEYDFSLSDLDPGIQGEHAPENTRFALSQLESLRDAGESKLPPLDLTQGDVADLVAFLEALTDPCVEDRDCIGRWVPDSSDTGPDNLQLNAVGEDGDSL